MEITQIKEIGDAPVLSPDDPFADFETCPITYRRSGANTNPRRGIIFAQGYAGDVLSEPGLNPYQFGVIGSTDGHTAYQRRENNSAQVPHRFHSCQQNERLGRSEDPGWAMSASGLAVWAEDNTRESTAAMRRREVYATSGPA